MSDDRLCSLAGKTTRRKRHSRERRRAPTDLDSAAGDWWRCNGKFEGVWRPNSTRAPKSTRGACLDLRSACCERRELRNRSGLWRRRRLFRSAITSVQLRGEGSSGIYHGWVADSSSFIRHGEILPNRSRVAPAMPSAFETPLSMSEPPVLSHSFFPINAAFSRTMRPRW